MRVAFLGLALLLAASAAGAQDLLRLQVSFDPAAAARLADMGERVTISAIYYGDPSAAGETHADAEGVVYLGSETFDIWPVDQLVILGGSLGGAPLAWVVQPVVNVNAFSARVADPDNILDCGIVEAPIADLVAAAQPILCKLIDG